MHSSEHVTEASAGAVIGSTNDLPISVLYVEEERTVSKVIKNMLELQGKFQVDAACSVREAYEKMEVRKYDVIVCDYQMPEEGGP